MALLTSKAVTLIKIEAVYKTDAAPTATDAVITGPVKWKLEGKDVQRKIVMPVFGELQSIPIGETIGLEFPIEIMGSGTAATPVKPLSLLLRAAGFSETITSSCVYKETQSADIESVTIYFYNDGILYKAVGCTVDSMKFDFKANDIGIVSVKMTGIFGGNVSTTITDTAIITPTFGTLQLPPIFSNASLVFETGIGGISKLEFTITNKTVKRLDPNQAAGVQRISVTGREIKGTMDPDMTALATWNPWALWQAATPAALSFNLGQTTGNKWTFAFASVNKNIPQIADKSGIAGYSLAWISNPTLAGVDRITASHV